MSDDGKGIHRIFSSTFSFRQKKKYIFHNTAQLNKLRLCFSWHLFFYVICFTFTFLLLLLCFVPIFFRTPARHTVRRKVVCILSFYRFNHRCVLLSHRLRILAYRYSKKDEKEEKKKSKNK